MVVWTFVGKPPVGNPPVGKPFVGKPLVAKPTEPMPPVGIALVGKLVGLLVGWWPLIVFSVLEFLDWVFLLALFLCLKSLY